MKINKVYCFGGEEWILQEHHRCASLPTEQTKRFLQILLKKGQQITALRKMSRYQKDGKTKVIWMLNTKEKNGYKTN